MTHNKQQVEDEEITVRESILNLDHEDSAKTELFNIKKSSDFFDFVEDDASLKSRHIKSITAHSSTLKGMLKALPIVVGYLPLAFAFGIMAHDAGLSFVATLLLSVFVYAGSSQYVAVGLFAVGQPVVTIVFTTFIINLRHLLMATSLAPYLKTWTKTQQFLFGTELTDESFAVHSADFAQHRPHAIEGIITNFTAHASWVLGSVLGFVLGSVLGDIRSFGFDFALCGMFIAILVMQIRSRLMVLVAIFAGAVALMLHVYGLKTWAVILAAILGATLGALCELWKTPSSS